MPARTLLAALALGALAACHVPAKDEDAIFVEFHSDPAGAEVWVDGIFAGQTPLVERYEWPSIEHRKKVVFKLNGYIPETRAMTGDSSIIEVRMQEIIEMLAFRVESDPPGATLEYAGGRLGTTPADVRLASPSPASDLRVILPGYRSEVVAPEKFRTGEAVRVRLVPLVPRLP
jgi:hypothetical protein